MRQYVEMLHDRRQRHRKRRRQLANRGIRPLGEPHHERAPRRIGKRGESAVEGGGRKLNHVVKYNGYEGPVNTSIVIVREGGRSSNRRL